MPGLGHHSALLLTLQEAYAFAFIFASVTVAGQPFPLSLPVYSPGPKTRREVFIQNCVIWTILNARESRMGSRLAAAIATRNTTEMLLEKEKGLVGGQNTVSVTVANLSKAMGG